jgi:hypothetical protein
VRTKDEPEIYSPKCGCGRPIVVPYWHRACNLVFCDICIGSHKCSPVNGPITVDARPGKPVLLPAAPDDKARGETFRRNGTAKSHPLKRKKKR